MLCAVFIRIMDIYKNIKTLENYKSLLKSGMFWEFHPELTGDWDKDKVIICADEPKKYNVIYADPAWGFNKGVYQDNGRKDRLIDEQYPTMTKKEMQQLPVKEIADKDCALFLWVTDSHLKEGIELMEAWGFTYRTIVFIWKKITNKGNTCANVEAWTMKNCEVCILGAKGNMLQHKKANNIFQLIEAERTKHSKKPIEAIERIEKLFGDLPRVELFCRYPRNGWDVWGNEVESSVAL